MTKTNKNTETWIAILLGVFAILAIKSIFENDNSKIISKRGRKTLSDEDAMKSIDKKIKDSEENNQHQDILI